MRPGHRAHAFVRFPKGSRMSWQYCKFCGLITLKNEATRRAIADGCES